MVAQQEAIVAENSVVAVGHQETYHNQLQTINKNLMMIKGKRTKRPRPVSPLALTMSSTTTTTEEGGSAVSEDWTAAPNSAATSPEDEEQDMAHCLILLAQGTNNNNNNNNSRNNNSNNNDSSTNNLNIIKGGNVISSCYECKTCNKTFSSFQALGGHRASHKKPKLNNIAALSELKKSSPVIFSLLNHHDNHHHDDGTTLSLQISNSTLSPTNNNASTTNKTKVHECGICGAEFSSGQALGGHMRRHRPIGTTTPTTSNPNPEHSIALTNATLNSKNNVKDEKMTKNLLSLDLNLPAPEDEHHHHQQQRDSSSKFVFSSNEKTLVFAAASPQLVDCHY